MTNSEAQGLIRKETKLWEYVFGFRVIEWDFVQFWIARQQPIAQTLGPYLIELPSRAGYIWNSEDDGEVVPVLADYRDNSIRILGSWKKGDSK